MGTEYISRCGARGRSSLKGASLITFGSFPDPGCRSMVGALRLFGVVGDCGTAVFKTFGYASSSDPACAFVVVVGGSILGATGATERDPSNATLFGRRGKRGCSMTDWSFREGSRGATLALAFPFRCMNT
jgi:hypothetical protein